MFVDSGRLLIYNCPESFIFGWFRASLLETMDKICAKCGYYQEHGTRAGRDGGTRSRAYCKACYVDIARECQIGVSRREVDLAFLKQKGECGICGINLSTTRYASDHCHETGFFRGLLCKKCNCGIGYLDDNKELLLKGAEWVTR